MCMHSRKLQKLFIDNMIIIIILISCIGGGVSKSPDGDFFRLV